MEKETTIDEWRAEHDARVSCRNDLTEYGEWSLDNNIRPISAALNGVMEKYGAEIVRDVLAATVNGAPWDRRYDWNVKEWAQSVQPFPEPPDYDGKPLTYPEFHISSHPCAINIAARQYMQDEQWRTGYAALAACKEAFLWHNDLVKSYRYPRFFKKLNSIAKKHGIENVRQVLALTIKSINSDLAHFIDADVHAWAGATKPFPQPPNPYSEHRKFSELMLVTLHPIVINGSAKGIMYMEAQQRCAHKPKRGGDER